MTKTNHSHPCAVVPDAEALPPPSGPDRSTLNQGRNSDMSTTSDAPPTSWSLRVQRRASKLYAGAAVACLAGAPAAAGAGVPAPRLPAPAPQRGHAADSSAMLAPHCEQNIDFRL